MSSAGPPLTPGVYRVAGAEDTARALARSGWNVRLVGRAASTPGLYAELAGALELPRWFGANLDALWDCLTDLPVPTALVLGGWNAFEQAEPEQARRMMDVFAERTQVEPPFTVALAQD